MNIHLDEDLCDRITWQSLLESYYDLLDNEIEVPIFSRNAETEKKKVKKLLKSFYRVIAWYSNEEQMHLVRKVKDD